MKTNQEMVEQMGHFNVAQLSEEEWVDVDGYNGLYKISNYGSLISYRKGTPTILKCHITKKGYLRASFHIRPKQKSFFVHRLVANAFIPNKNNYTEINHINGNKLDNRVENLEWCSSKYNSWHKYNILEYKVSDRTKNKISLSRTGIKLSEEIRNKISKGHIGLKKDYDSVQKTAKSHFKKVYQFDKSGALINVFESMKDAANETKTSMSCISSVCNGRRKSANGYVWRFKQTT